MFEFEKVGFWRSQSWRIVALAIVLHLIWAACLLVDFDGARNTTALYTFSRVVGYFTPWFLTASATMAFLAMVHPFVRLQYAILVAPQQAILAFVAEEAVRWMMLGRFADGVVRSSAFLIADQSPSVIVAVLHFVAIVSIHKQRLAALASR